MPLKARPRPLSPTPLSLTMADQKLPFDPAVFDIKLHLPPEAFPMLTTTAIFHGITGTIPLTLRPATDTQLPVPPAISVKMPKPVKSYSKWKKKTKHAIAAHLHPWHVPGAPAVKPYQVSGMPKPKKSKVAPKPNPLPLPSPSPCSNKRKPKKPRRLPLPTE